jgi:hypothetical protein
MSDTSDLLAQVGEFGGVALRRASVQALPRRGNRGEGEGKEGKAQEWWNRR